MRNICCQSTIRNLHAATTFSALRFSAAKDINSILHAAAAARNLDTAIPLRSAETELQNTIEDNRSTHMYAQQIAAPKPDLDAKAETGSSKPWYKAKSGSQRVLEKVAEKVPEKALRIFGAGPGQAQQVQQGFQRLASQHASERFVTINIAAVGDATEAYFFPESV